MKFMHFKSPMELEYSLPVSCVVTMIWFPLDASIHLYRSVIDRVSQFNFTVSSIHCLLITSYYYLVSSHCFQINVWIHSYRQGTRFLYHYKLILSYKCSTFLHYKVTRNRQCIYIESEGLENYITFGSFDIYFLFHATFIFHKLFWIYM